MCESIPPAVMILPSPAMTSVPAPTTRSGCHAIHDIWIASLANARDETVLDTNVGLVDTRPIDDQRIGNDGVNDLFVLSTRRLSHALTDRLATTKRALITISCQILLNLDPQWSSPNRTKSPVVGPNMRIVCSRHGGTSICTTLRLVRERSQTRLPAASRDLLGTRDINHVPLRSYCHRESILFPAISTSVTVLVSPGSKRIEVPAGISKRNPYALIRSNSS